MDVEIRKKTDLGSNYICNLSTPYIPRVGDKLEIDYDIYTVREVCINTDLKHGDVIGEYEVHHITIYVS